MKCGDYPYARTTRTYKPQDNEACRQSYSSDKGITVCGRSCHLCLARRTGSSNRTDNGGDGYCDRIAGRNLWHSCKGCMASKMGIAVGGGVIDADYIGEIKIILRNQGLADCLYKAGDLIAQLIIEKLLMPTPLK